ncbi:transcription initiation factor TFIID subunit 4 [Eutrema salsugineum]|uniref:transcription initiation factor TFIID subunit 4 n=1 Tax=Eutrema salsugineum TaxID=72664 RepID=UPI000CECE6D1|nr:transcription initiation factor TFIID subunit 4 [Eutrema salsugineum]
MIEQHRSGLVNQNHELKQEYESHPQHNPSQDLRQADQLWENPSYVLQGSNLQSKNKPISSEPEMPQPQYLEIQKTSSQCAHGTEQPVHPVNHGPKEVQVCELLRVLIAQVDKDREKHLRTLFCKFKRKELTKESFLRYVRDAVGDQMIRLATRNLLQSEQVSNVPMKQSNGNPRTSTDDLGKQSSKMVLSTSTTHESFVSPSMKTQMDSSIMVNIPAPSRTINVRTTPKMPYVGQKKPFEALGSSLPPSSKKQKLRGDYDDRSIEQINDVTALINLQEEERKLLYSGAKEDSRVSKASRRAVHEEEERTILQKNPLQRKLAVIMAKSGVEHINDDVEQCLSLCVEERMRGLLSDIIRMSKQRTDAPKCRNRTCITSDIRKQINEMNQKVKEEWETKHGGKRQNEGNDTAKEDTRSEQMKEQDERRIKVANVAALASIGGDNPFLKWKLMVEARQKLSSRSEIISKNETGEPDSMIWKGGRRFGKNQGSPKVARSISVKDVFAVVEKEPQMSKSTLLYRLYNRICSDVPTQEKT